MLKIILDKQVIYAAIGIVAALGGASKCIVNLTLKRLVHAAGNMSKSTHPFMRLVRAKFEHACMVSEKVENVDVFVDKYLYDYKVGGIKLHSIRRMEKAAAFTDILLGIGGAFLEYQVNGMRDEVLKTGAVGIAAGIFVYLFHLTTDENYRLAVVKNYMVDYLQNVCLHRYEKTYQKELQVMATEKMATHSETEAETEMKIEPQTETHTELQKELNLPREAELQEESNAQREPEVCEMPEAKVMVRETVSRLREKGAFHEPVRTTVNMDKPERKVREEISEELPVEKERASLPKDVLIRQILEEFMA